jgi:hypothetical protein
MSSFTYGSGNPLYQPPRPPVPQPGQSPTGGQRPPVPQPGQSPTGGQRPPVPQPGSSPSVVPPPPSNPRPPGTYNPPSTGGGGGGGGGGKRPPSRGGTPPPPPPPPPGKPDWLIQWEMQQAAQKMQQAAQAEENRRNARVTAIGLAEVWGLNESIVDKMIDLIINQGYNAENVYIPLMQTSEFKERFAGIEAYNKKWSKDIAAGVKAQAPTPGQYIQMERQYQEILNRFGLSDLASRSTYADLIGGDVSPFELQDRVVLAYDRIANADDLLKQQLKSYFPNLTTPDFARALLTSTNPEDMASQLQRRVQRAEISSEMSRFGLEVRAPLAQELETLGVDRDRARQGFGTIAAQLPTLSKLGNIYEGTSAGIEDELVGEQFKGLQSQRRRRLQQTEVATFSGASGMTTESLARASGSF